MTFYILDCETTGLGDCDIIELAYFKVSEDSYKHRDWNPNASGKERINSLKALLESSDASVSYANLYKPDKDIHKEASKVHGLYYKDVMYAPHHSNIRLPEDICTIIGHNVGFDWRALKKPNVSQICTMQIAKKAWPKNTKGNPFPENYKLSGLIEFLYPTEAKELLNREFHRALSDCLLTYLVLYKILEHYKKIENLEQLISLTKQGE